jgi:hypothetical protein
MYVLACSPPIHGQSPPNSARCFPLLSLTSDDKAELTGEKVRPRVIVDSLVFDGPTSLPTSIREQLVTDLNEKTSLSADTNWVEWWNDVVIRDAWMNEGFFKMTSTAKAQIIRSDAIEQHVAVTVHVDEGIQYRLKDIRFGKEPQIVPAAVDSMQPDSDEAPDNGRTVVPLLHKKVEFPEFQDTEHLNADLVFPSQELRRHFPLNDGDVLDASKIKEGLGDLIRLYQSRGYIDFAATPETITDDKNAMISLVMVLVEGKQFRVGKVVAYNLDPEREGKLKSLIQLGDIYNSELFGEFFHKNHLFISVLLQNYDNGTIDLQFGYPTRP